MQISSAKGIATALASILACLFRTIGTQAVGQGLVMLQYGEIFVTSFGGGGRPQYLMIGAWYQWSNCGTNGQYITEHNFNTLKQFSTVTSTAKMTTVEYTSGSSSTQAIKYQCGQWIGFANVYSKTGGGYSLNGQIHMPGTTPSMQVTPLASDLPCNYTSMNSSYNAFVFNPGLNISNMFYMLVQVGGAYETANGCLDGFIEVMTGLPNKVPQVTLNLFKYFVLPTPMTIDGVPISGDALINNGSVVTQSGLNLIQSATPLAYVFPGIFSLPYMNSSTVFQACGEIVISFFRPTNVSGDSPTTNFIKVKSATGTLIDYLNFTYDPTTGTVTVATYEGSNPPADVISISSATPKLKFNLRIRICPTNTLGSTLTTVNTQVKLWIEETGESATSKGFMTNKAQYWGEPADLLINSTSPSSLSSFFIWKIIAYTGGLDGNIIVGSIAQTNPTNPCQVPTLYWPGSSATTDLTNCLFCPSNTYYSATAYKCILNSAASPANATCLKYSTPPNCIDCDPAGYFYNLVGDYCTSNALPCNTGEPTLVSYGATDCNDPVNVAICNAFQTLSAGACPCTLSGCQTCLLSQCEACVAGKILQIAADGSLSCTATLSAGYGYDLEAAITTSRPCLSVGCANCSVNYLVCTTCNAGTNLCTTPLTCDSSCTTCSAPGPTNCLTCTSPNYFFPNNNTCAPCTSNGNGYSLITTNCVMCAANCKTCSANTATTCLSCMASSYLFTSNSTCGPCVTASGFYTTTQASPASNVCAPCDTTCKTCSGGAPNNCLSCPAGRVYNPVTHVCGTSCAVTSFNNAGVCTACANNCYSCLSTTSCITCVAGFFFNSTNLTCTPCTGSGYYQNTAVTPNTCQWCDATCSTCNGLLNSNCLTCAAGLFYNATLPASGSCIACNVAGWFTSGTNCSACDPNCLNCTGLATNCSACPTGTSMYLNHTCTPCTDPAFVSSFGWCLPCVYPCSTCSGSNTSCTTCAGGLVLFPNNLTCTTCFGMPGWFISILPIDSHGNLNVPTCIQCVSTCLSCTGVSTFCTSCYPGAYLYPNNVCGACTESGMYISGNSCLPCNTTCATCLGTAGNCTSCSNALYLYPNNTCGNCFNVGYFKNISNLANPLCSLCMPTCASCVSGQTCSSCISGLYLFQNLSCGICSSSRMTVNLTNCLPCDPSCLTCKGILTTSCTSCSLDKYLTPDGQCLLKGSIALTNSFFIPDLKQVVFKFDRQLQGIVADISTISQCKMYLNKEQDVIDATTVLLSNTKVDTAPDLTQLKSLTEFDGYKVRSLTIVNNQLQAALEISKTFSGASFLIVFSSLPGLQAEGDINTVYLQQMLTADNIGLISTFVDTVMSSIAKPLSYVLGIFAILMFVVSVPQGIFLLRIFQTLNYYTFIDCEFPNNFSVFLQMFSNAVVGLLPNFFSPLASDRSVPPYTRFQQFGVNVNIFLNVGQQLTLACMLGCLKLITAGISMIFMKSKISKYTTKINEFLAPKVFVGIVESFNIDIILSIFIHIQFGPFSKGKLLGLDYLAIIFICLLAMGLVVLYIFMIYTVQRITKAYIEHSIIEIKDMPSEHFSHWLADKKMTGNFLQKNLNVLLLLKDVLNCTLLMSLYYNPLVVVIVISSIQFFYALLAVAAKPYQMRFQNILLIITECSYLVLDLLFLINISGKKMSPQMRYYAMGFSMIGVVMLIIISSVSITSYHKYKDFVSMWKGQPKSDDASVRSAGSPSDVSEAVLGNSEDNNRMVNQNDPTKSPGVTFQNPLVKVPATGKRIKKTMIARSLVAKKIPASKTENILAGLNDEVPETKKGEKKGSNGTLHGSLPPAPSSQRPSIMQSKVPTERKDQRKVEPLENEKRPRANSRSLKK